MDKVLWSGNPAWPSFGNNGTPSTTEQPQPVKPLVSFLIDQAGEKPAKRKPGSLSNYGVSLNTTSLSPGNHTIQGKVVQANGVSGLTEQRRVSVGESPLTIAVVAPLTDNQQVSGVFTLSADVTGGIIPYTVTFLNGATTLGTAQPTGYGWIVNWDTRTVTDGTYSVTAKVTDANGKEATSLPRKVQVVNGNVPPSSTPTPSPTPAPGATKLALTIFLHGIGRGGDSANPNSQGSPTPLHFKRRINIEIFNPQNQLVVGTEGEITYDSSSGSFKGIVDVGSPLQTGNYTVKVKTSQYLKTLVPGIQALSSGETNELSPTFLLVGDINGDNIINILDYNILTGCYSDLLPPDNCNEANKMQSDITDDGNVNQFDYNLFLRESLNKLGE